MATRTGQQLLQGFSEFICDWWAETATGGTTSTLVDTLLRRHGDDAIRDFYLRINEAAHGADQQVRRISAFVESTGTATVKPDFGAAPTSSTCYELHRYDPTSKFQALDRARLQLVDKLFIERRNDEWTSDGRNDEFTIPTSLRLGPEWAIVESPIQVEVAENWLQTPKMDTLTGWTASGTTALIITRDCANLLIPKLGENATRLTTAANQAATYTQTAANLCSEVCTPLTLARDNRMYGGVWVHATETCKVRLNLIDLAGTTNGSFHGGTGWEFLTADRTICGVNTTTLSFQLCVASTSNASVLHAQCAMFRIGPIPNFYHQDGVVRVERCEISNRVYIRNLPSRGTQIRLIGKGEMTALGEATPQTSTMEVDVNSAELLFARAARILFGGDMLNTPGFRDIATRIGWVAENEKCLSKKWQYKEKGGVIVTPFRP